MLPALRTRSNSAPARTSLRVQLGGRADRSCLRPFASALESPTESPATRVAVVGAGFIADFHLEILSALDTVEVVAICEPDERRARRAAERFDVPRVVGDVAELQPLDVDVAHVLVPPHLHAEVTRRLLELGIGVFVEKPIALSVDEARALADLARERGLALAVNHNAVFRPVFQRLLKDLRAGLIGKVEHVQVTLSVPLRQLDAGDTSHWMFRDPANIVFEQATHPFSQLVELVGRVQDLEVTHLGTRELQPGQDFHDRWLIAARAERGTAELYLGFGAGFPRSTLQVLGTDGSLEVDLHHDHFARETKTQWLEFWNSFLAGWRRGGGYRRSALGNLWDYARLTLGMGRREDGFFASMRGSIQDFHRALRSGTSPTTGAEHGLHVTEWCAAATRGLEPSTARPAATTDDVEARPGEVCVLGANGFIGRRTVASLLERDLFVTAVVRRLDGLPRVLTDGVKDGRVRLLRASLTDPEALRRAIHGARVVVHLATGGGDNWPDLERAMVHGTRDVAEACLDEGVERLVYVSSTAALYLGRDAGRDLSDSVGPDPRPELRALYARGKEAAERELMRLHRERRLPVTIVRPAVVLGQGAPLQHSGIGLWVRDNHCVGWGLGRDPIPVVLVEDVGDALARLAAHEGSDLDGRGMNLASKAPLTPRDIVAAYRARTGRAFHFHPRSLALSQALELGKYVVKKVGGRRDAEPPHYRDLKSRELYPRLTCERAREILDWRPCDDADEFLQRYLGGPR